MKPLWKTRRIGVCALILTVSACSPVASSARRSASAPPREPTAGTSGDAHGGDGEGPSGAPREALGWADLSPATFARAKAENRLVVVDGSAEWCHWCHVMEATSYHDPDVRQIIDSRFIAVKVDVDSRPDFEERYVDWGWPATVLMTADGVELGKYKGYLPPERFVEILRAAAEGAKQASEAKGGPPGADTQVAIPEARALSRAELDAAYGRTVRALDAYWDARQGGWGVPQKAPLVWENAWSLGRARGGDAAARERALRTLDQQRLLVDRVWGGMAQYSTDGDWLHPHHEKLMTVQAGAIANYAEAYALTHDAAWLATAQQVRGFVDHFMTAADGAFLTTMDADLNAHEPAGSGRPYVAGNAYYAKDDAARRALGVPRVDAHEYARENGLAIDAYVTLYDATHDSTALQSARAAAARVLSTHTADRGGVTGITHAARPDDDATVLYLADNAALGFGLVHLYQATGDTELRAAAQRIADFLLRDLKDPHGGFDASTRDPNAVGVFALRRQPFEDNVMAARFLARLDKVAHDERYAPAIAGALAIVTRPDAVEARGRKIGDLLLAIDETR